MVVESQRMVVVVVVAVVYVGEVTWTSVEVSLVLGQRSRLETI